MLDFVNMGFILTLGLILLICGALMLYGYKRLNVLENSIIEHGKILQSFIMDYQSNRSNIKQNNLATQEAINAVQLKEQLLTDTEYMDGGNKIDISDNDNSEDEEDDDNSEDEEDDDDDNDDDENNEDDENEDNIINLDSNSKKILSNDNIDLTIKIIDINSSGPLTETTDLGINNDDNDKNCSSAEDDKSDTNSESSNEDNIIELINEVSNLKRVDYNDITIQNENDKSNSIQLTNEDDNDNDDNDDDDDSKKIPFSKMKVDVLRELALSKGLINQDNSNKLKKNDLVKLLQDN